MLDLKEFEKAAKDAGIYALDVETTGTDVYRDRLVCISMAVGERSWFVPIMQLPGAVSLGEAREWLNTHVFNDPDLMVVMHNGKFDLEVLINHGFVILNKPVDTMIGEYLVNETGAAPLTAKAPILGLKELLSKYFQLQRPSWEEISHLAFLCPQEFETYSRNDSLDVWKLWHEITHPGLKREGPKIEKMFWDMEMPLMTVLMEMEMTGLQIDVDQMEKTTKESGRKIMELAEEIYKLSGKRFNIKSSEQLSDVLFAAPPNGLGLRFADMPKLAKSTDQHPIYSTSKDNIKKLRKSHKVIPLIEEHRKLGTLYDVFLKKLLAMARENEDHRIHPSFKQTRTRMGRLASENPNSQNMPRKGGIRDCVVAPEGKVLIVGDLNQVEYRILAHMSRDPVLLKAYREGADIHGKTMEVAGVERTQAKNVNFGIVYGLSIPSLAEFLGVSVRRAGEIYDTVYGAYKEIPKYKYQVFCTMLRQGYVESIFGRRRRFHGLKSETDDYFHRQAVHHTISGSAADVIKIGMNKLHAKLVEARKEEPIWRKAKMLAQVHDEIVMEVPQEIAEESRAMMQSSMEDVGGGRLLVDFKAEVGVGPTWTTAKV